MLYVTDRRGMEYAVTDTLDNTTEYITDWQLRQLVAKGVNVYGVTLKGSELHTLVYPDLQAIVDNYNSRFLALGKKPQFSVVVCENTSGKPANIVCEGVCGSTVRVANMDYTCAGHVKMPDFIEGVSDFCWKEDYHFGYVDYDSLVLSKNLRSLRSGMFNNSTIRGSLVLPQSLRRTYGGAFRNCYIKGDLYIPEGLGTIERADFMYCHIAGDLYLPSSIKRIDSEAFSSCKVGGKVLFSTPPKEYRDVDVARDAWLLFACTGYGEGVKEFFKL